MEYADARDFALRLIRQLTDPRCRVVGGPTYAEAVEELMRLAERERRAVEVIADLRERLERGG